MAKRKTVYLALLIFLFSTLGGGTKNSADKRLRVFFPFKHLKADSTIIDPSNTASVYEYYLLENLGAGLVRDDVSDVRGYTGLLASHWEQLSPKHWAFVLKNGLKWSDGSDITSEQIRSHFEILKHRPSRHLLNLKNLDRVKYDPTKNTLHFHFKKITNVSLLHELSLADAVLIDHTNKTPNWKVTSGHYSVEDYNPGAKTLDLRINPNCPGFQSDSPARVQLFDVTPSNDTSKLFSDVETDIYSINDLPLSPERKALILRAPQHLLGQPSLLFFWKFNPTHPLVGDLNARRELADIIAQSFKGLRIGDEVSYYAQLVPPGYQGTVPKFEFPRAKTSALKGKRIFLRFRPAFQYLTREIEKLKALAKERSIDLKLAFDAFTANEVADASEFARVQGFKGNQKDSIGSWSFLYTKDKGDLSPFLTQAKSLIDKALVAESENNKVAALSDLHRFSLENAFAVPFVVYKEHIMTSNRVDLGYWNRFDLRLRFYDVRWKP